MTGDEELAARSRVDRYSSIARRVIAGEEPRASSAGAAICGVSDVGDEIPVGAVKTSLGCGNPLAAGGLTAGEIVLDIGSGGGLDVLRSASRVGSNGRVIGLDANAEMLELARRHAAQAGATKVDFLQGMMEDIPLPDAHVDVVISNCVINLSSDKTRAVTEAFRVLRPDGRLAVSDVIAEEGIDPDRKAEAEARNGCGVGTLTAASYRDLMIDAGFVGVSVDAVGGIDNGLSSALVRGRRPNAPDGLLVRPMWASDGPEVLSIYQIGLDTGDASFETTAPEWGAFDGGKLRRHRYVAVTPDTGAVVGWVAAGAVSSRAVYAGVAEHSVYVHPDYRRRGVARTLLMALIGSTESAGMWTLQTGVFPENATSLRAHLDVGFRVLGTRERIGQHHGRWRDVVFLERRSPVIS